MKHHAEFAVERPGSQVETQKIRNGQCSQCIPAAPKERGEAGRNPAATIFLQPCFCKVARLFYQKVDMGAFD